MDAEGEAVSFSRAFRSVTVAFFAYAAALSAHIGSPDVYLDADAGPYRLFVTVRAPQVIPGVAQLEVRSGTPDVTSMHATPLGMMGATAKFVPNADALQRSKNDPQFFTGTLWLMKTGSWQVRLFAQGARGSGEISIPFPAVARRTRTMQAGLGAALFALMSFLILGLVAIAGAALREAQLEPGVLPSGAQRYKGRIVMGATFLLLIAIVWLGNRWWKSDANAYGQNVYKPLRMAATLENGNPLQLTISDPGWLQWRKIDDFVPDHNHLMHLYMIREPGMDAVYHLHPDMKSAGVFQLDLPSLRSGQYWLYADVVHEDGFPETLVATVRLPDIKGRPLAGDDAFGATKPLTEESGSSTSFALPDGYRMLWDGGTQNLRAKQPRLFRFRLLDPAGKAPGDMAFYMGMLGHAAFVKTDGSAFAHIHPNGSVAMAAFMMAEAQISSSGDRMNMQGMSMNDTRTTLPNEVAFPYGFPTAGRYRIFVQMKHGNRVKTGIFDANVQ